MRVVATGCYLLLPFIKQLQFMEFTVHDFFSLLDLIPLKDALRFWLLLNILASRDPILVSLALF